MPNINTQLIQELLKQTKTKHPISQHNPHIILHIPHTTKININIRLTITENQTHLKLNTFNNYNQYETQINLADPQLITKLQEHLNNTQQLTNNLASASILKTILNNIHITPQTLHQTMTPQHTNNKITTAIHTNHNHIQITIDHPQHIHQPQTQPQTITTTTNNHTTTNPLQHPITKQQLKQIYQFIQEHLTQEHPTQHPNLWITKNPNHWLINKSQ